MTKAFPRNFGMIFFVYLTILLTAVLFFVMSVWTVRIVLYTGRFYGLIMTPFLLGFSIYLFYTMNKFREMNFTSVEVNDVGIAFTKGDETEVIIPFSSITGIESEAGYMRVDVKFDIDLGYGKGIIPIYTIPKEFQEKIYEEMGKR